VLGRLSEYPPPHPKWLGVSHRFYFGRDNIRKQDPVGSLRNNFENITRSLHFFQSDKLVNQKLFRKSRLLKFGFS
jgi:hypothetical protein